MSLSTTLRASSSAVCGMASQISSQVKARMGAKELGKGREREVERGLGAAALGGVRRLAVQAVLHNIEVEARGVVTQKSLTAWVMMWNS